MTEDPGQGPPGERILDLLVYAPVGLAVSVVEAMPGLVRKGRERLAPQVGVARMVGQFAVRQGCRQFAGFAASRGAFPFRPAKRARTYTVYSAKAPGSDEAGAVDGQAGPVQPGPAQPVQAEAGPAPAVPAQPVAAQPFPAPPVQAQPVPGPPAEPVVPPIEPVPGLAAADLAIPSYDSLSATQVVERLAGLSRDEIRAVAAYEAATRRRKTVITRAEQLLKK